MTLVDFDCCDWFVRDARWVRVDLWRADVWPSLSVGLGPCTTLVGLSLSVDCDIG